MPDFIRTDRTKFMTAPKGRSACCCVRCEKFFPSDKNPDAFGALRTMKCPSCDTIYSYPEERTYILPNSIQRMNTQACKQLMWYHTTLNPNWFEEVTSQEDLLVHIGTKEAAEDMANNFLVHGHKTVYTYWLKVLSPTSISPDFVLDTNEWPDYYDKYNHAYDAHRYVNDFESPGSVSMLVRTDRLEQQGRAVLKAPRNSV